MPPPSAGDFTLNDMLRVLGVAEGSRPGAAGCYLLARDYGRHLASGKVLPPLPSRFVAGASRFLDGHLNYWADAARKELTCLK